MTGSVSTSLKPSNEGVLERHHRLVARGIDIAPYPLSHLAARVADWDLCVHQRTLLERHAKTNRENVWNRLFAQVAAAWHSFGDPFERAQAHGVPLAARLEALPSSDTLGSG